MNTVTLTPIGIVQQLDGRPAIIIDPPYRAALQGLADYGHVQVLWWADRCDPPADRRTLVEAKPYKRGPDRLGVFALRSPERPNPIAVSNAPLAAVDEAAGIVFLHYIDALPGTPVLDLKPYTPSLDRIERPVTPEWCSHWPRSVEESAAFDWAAEFNF